MERVVPCSIPTAVSARFIGGFAVSEFFTGRPYHAQCELPPGVVASAAPDLPTPLVGRLGFGRGNLFVPVAGDDHGLLPRRCPPQKQKRPKPW